MVNSLTAGTMKVILIALKTHIMTAYRMSGREHHPRADNVGG